MNLVTLRRLLWAAVAMALVVALKLLWHPDAPQSNGQTISIGGPFSMTNQFGQKITEASFRGRPLAMFFGFTNCPDVCPTTLFRLSDLLKDLGEDGKGLQIVLVSVDPERDTPEVLRQYLEQFGSQFSGLTGTPEQLSDFAEKYRFYYKKVPQSDGNYTMDHSAGVFLFDERGSFKGTLDIHEDIKTVTAKLRRLVHISSPSVNKSVSY